MYATNVCRRDGDVLLRNNTLEDELHTRIPFATQNQTYINITTIYVRSMESLSLRADDN